MRNYLKVNDHSKNAYDDKRQIGFKNSMLRSNLCDYSDAYILVKGTIAVTSQNNLIKDKKNGPLVLKNIVPFHVFQKLMVN